MPAPKGNKFAEGNEGGAPTKYLKKYAKEVYKLCLLGAIDKEMADFFEVAESTFYLWKKEHKEFSEAISKGKIAADAQVAEKLFKRALGYSHRETKLFQYEGKIISKNITKHYPPDVTAIKYWLNNRQRHKWREKIEHGVTDGEGNDVPLPTTLHVNITGDYKPPVNDESDIEDIEEG